MPIRRSTYTGLDERCGLRLCIYRIRSDRERPVQQARRSRVELMSELARLKRCQKDWVDDRLVVWSKRRCFPHHLHQRISQPHWPLEAVWKAFHQLLAQRIRILVAGDSRRSLLCDGGHCCPKGRQSSWICLWNGATSLGQSLKL